MEKKIFIPCFLKSHEECDQAVWVTDSKLSLIGHVSIDTAKAIHKDWRFGTFQETTRFIKSFNS